MMHVVNESCLLNWFSVQFLVGRRVHAFWCAYMRVHARVVRVRMRVVNEQQMED